MKAKFENNSSILRMPQTTHLNTFTPFYNQNQPPKVSVRISGGCFPHFKCLCWGKNCYKPASPNQQVTYLYNLSVPSTL